MNWLKKLFAAKPKEAPVSRVALIEADLNALVARLDPENRNSAGIKAGFWRGVESAAKHLKP